MASKRRRCLTSDDESQGKESRPCIFFRLLPDFQLSILETWASPALLSSGDSTKSKSELSLPCSPASSMSLSIWKSGTVLAKYLAQIIGVGGLRGKRVLELGAGVGLPGLAALIVCDAHKVILSDYFNQNYMVNEKSVMDQAKWCINNSIIDAENFIAPSIDRIEAMNIRWGFITEIMCKLPPQDLIIGSDIFYDSLDFKDILTTIKFFLNRAPCHARFLTAYHCRSSSRNLSHILFEFGLTGEKLDITGIDTGVPGEIQIYEIKQKAL
eukprot:UC4_evm5s135